MSHTYTKSHFHVVFSTKERRKSIPKEIQPRLWAYMTGICRNHDIVPVVVGGISDHVHALFHLPATLSLSKGMLLLKSNSSRWMNEHARGFAWQEGYGAFSVSASVLPAVTRYIQNQEQHHRKISFEDEFLALLKKHGIEYDPKYVFG